MKENDSSDPKFHDATFYPLTTPPPRFGTLASPGPRNPGSGRLAGAGRRNCKQWPPGLPPPFAHTESQPSRRTPASDVGYRAWTPASPRSSGPARSSLLASENAGSALGGLTTIPRAPKAQND